MKVERLRDLETRYGGGRSAVERRRVSPHDPRLRPGETAAAIPGKMVSGGRFIPNRFYAETYADRFSDRAGRFVMVELGVLLGVGLAVWCDVFPEARVIGLDIDPERFDERTLRARGAFASNTPEVHFFDELADDNGGTIEAILAGERIDVLIDDAMHDDRSILKAMADFMPFMADEFLYFIEDNNTVDEPIRKEWPDLMVSRRGKLTVVSNG